MSRKGNVYKKDLLAGIIEETGDGYTFSYDNKYLSSASATPVSLTLPLSPDKFESRILFPFFDGLIPEGWLLEAAARNWKIDSRDRMGLLLAVCRDCIGDVWVESAEETVK